MIVVIHIKHYIVQHVPLKLDFCSFVFFYVPPPPPLLTSTSGAGEAMGTAAPIIINVYPRNDGVLSRRLIVGIRIPTIYQQSPPTPTDEAIRIEERPGMTVYALQFGGFAGESEYRAEALRLTRTLGETAPFQRKQYFCCSYDPPLKPYGRRNEVWFLQEEP
ncbi:heme-binding protein 1 [Xyrichtys novacula]|uniref:Heme-binding protein 1 n=1 Tax=Xyrichtys novacula TaxID=13765 RepID=A0AAV1GT88_XYRNO|nr:heme-binding protein 1 [Xyrichtys novacula]